MKPQALLGTKVGPYEIVGWLGSGGMGEVYRARDPRLGRDVALKLITGSLAGDAGRVRRFEQEARAAGQLNHPNVLAVYDIGVFNGVPYIVSELLEGSSLRSRLSDGPLGWRKILDYAKQAAEGLAAAHDRGIVHRDVKPDNLFITADGRIKILDFGIAKLAATDDASGGHTNLPTDTATGTVIGTAAYMSPEQVRGESVDARSDIFSLGVVLYEMITGRPAFRRETSAETMAAILKEEPPEPAPMTEAPALARIVSRCLEKSRETRFQSARDLAFGLDVLSGSQVTAVAAAAPRRRWVATAAMTIVAGSMVAAPAIWLMSKAPAPIENLLVTAKWSWFTDFEGSEIDATISPDGKVVAFMADRDGPFHVWVKPVGTGSFQDLTPDRGDLNTGIIRNIGFNFDGSELWLAGRPARNGTPGQRLTLLPVMGGTPRVFLPEHAANMAWAPDGTRLAYYTRPDDPIVVADADDSNERQILPGRTGDHNHSVVFSPDSRWIYYTHADQSISEYDIYRIPVAGGTPEPLAIVHSDVRDLTPLDNRWVLFVAHGSNDGSGPWLWALDVEQRQTHRVSVGLERYLSVAGSADGRHLVASIVKSTAAGLWSMPMRDGLVEEREVTLFKMSSARALSPRFATASTLFYLSSSGGGGGLWRIQDGQAVDIRMGAGTPIVETPSVSKDGDRVAVVVGTPDKKRIMIVSADGAVRRWLSDAVDVRGTSTWSTDGTSIITGGNDEHGPGLFSVPVDGGAPRRLKSGQATDPVLSPNGQIIVYLGPQTPNAPLLAMRLDGTAVPLPLISPGGHGRFRFRPDGKLVYLKGDTGAQDFWLLDIPTQHSQQLTKLSSPATINTFDISPDGSRIVFDRVRDLADVALIDLARR